MSAVERGIVLDAETAALVAQNLGYRSGTPGLFVWARQAVPGDILTHIGGRPVADVVAAHDKAKDYVESLRFVADDLDGEHPYAPYAARDAADFLDRCADLLIDARLVAAAHAQWADTEEVERG